MKPKAKARVRVGEVDALPCPGLYSRSNLLISGVAGRTGVLAQLRFDGDGSTVAADGSAVLACGPVRGKVGWPEETPLASPPSEGVGADVDTVDQAIKNLPRGGGAAVRSTALCGLTSADAKVELTSLSRRHEKRVACRPMPPGYPAWRGIVRDVAARASVGRVCVSRSRLLGILTALSRAAPEKPGADPVWIEFGGLKDGLVLRGLNRDTSQHLLGVIKPLDAGAYWLPHDSWERGVLGVETKRLKQG